MNAALAKGEESGFTKDFDRDALNHLRDKNTAIKLSQTQFEMLDMGDDDIKNNRVVSKEELEKMEMDWHKSLKLK